MTSVLFSISVLLNPILIHVEYKVILIVCLSWHDGSSPTAKVSIAVCKSLDSPVTKVSTSVSV